MQKLDSIKVAIYTQNEKNPKCYSVRGDKKLEEIERCIETRDKSVEWYGNHVLFSIGHALAS